LHKESLTGPSSMPSASTKMIKMTRTNKSE
jgi:hypothetical protein